jgi:hypothetical protein
MHKPKETKEIYVDSLSINSSNLERQLREQTISPLEINEILAAINSKYTQRVESIIEECNKDMMALERVPSPLRLFIECLAESDRSLKLSSRSQRLIRGYVSSWEEWM